MTDENRIDLLNRYRSSQEATPVPVMPTEQLCIFGVGTQEGEGMSVEDFLACIAAFEANANEQSEEYNGFVQFNLQCSMRRSQ